ncbi:MAG: hypothetical protein RL721_2153, partial [Candidatus Eisenbacteria bacterium]
MIDRYARPEMAAVWSDERRLALWLEVELAATRARENRGEVPAGTCERIRQRTRLDLGRMLAIEAEVHHDVIAFLSMVAETAGDDARHLHAGMTSSDLVDTALACQIQEAGRVLVAEVNRLRHAAWGLAQRHKRTVMVGRSHGVHAEPITFGLKALVWSEELGRGLDRLQAGLQGCAVGKYSGAMGTLAHLDADIEDAALESLGLEPEPIANQVVQRDRHAALLCAIAVLGGTLDKIATEVRHLMRTEVREAEEPFTEKQKGSSAMPHKRNPVRCERVSGLARLLRGYAVAGLEDQPLWHERDISHSSVERVVLPDAFLAAHFMAQRGAHARQPRRRWRPRAFAARVAGTDRRGVGARRGLPCGPAPRARRGRWRHAVPGGARRRSGGDRAPHARTDRRLLRPVPSPAQSGRALRARRGASPMTTTTSPNDAWTTEELADPAAVSRRLKTRGVSLDAEEVVLLERLLGRSPRWAEA